MARGHSEILFTLVQCFVQPYNILTDTFGTAVELPETQTFEFGFVADTDQIKAAGYLQHLLTVTTHATFKLGSAGIPFEAMVTIAGATNSSSVASPNQLRRLRFSAGSSGLPYFALVGRLVGEQSDDAWIGLPCNKLDNVPGFKVEQNKFIMAEAGGRAIKSGTRNLVEVFGHETALAITAGNIGHIWG